ncbi:iron chelate uptake ABC transporter family permease subunit [Acholeplasma vituli]|uniref:Iron chelate uptake ABC transporter family permease subunit n=1 Tax=Paracholeplasma vituli TaxID=69473 RepID=A0ABT2PWF7_9MOLU|nr:iron chelate uptake ABC transporter family permease subunit [Paracholeplasma vituli]MCU0105285.1 iron chelate uptake ABC transporter family permease subunit [Paracholeplasma vituli]
MKKRLYLYLLFIVLLVMSIFVGVSDIKIQDIVSLNKEAWFLLWTSRIPRTLAIILTAVGLSISGLILQTISKNKFISPSVVGVTDSAQLGILLAYLLLGTLSLTFKLVFAFGFAVLGSFMFITILNKIKFKNEIYVPLIGMMFGSIVAAIVSFLAYQFNATQFVDTIGVGSFTTKIAGNYELLYVIVPPLILAFIYMVQFNIIGIGEDFAKNLGVNYKRTMMIGLVIISMVSAAIFVVVGSIPFIGLVVPNLVSIYYGDNVKKNALDIALFGSIFVLIGDILSRMIIYPYEIPVSLTMGVLGSIIFLYLIYRRVYHAK